MGNLTKLNRRRWAVQLALTTGLALLFIAALLWSFGGAVPALADPGTLYVGGASGQDILTCGTTITPCQTISYTLNSRASGGDTIRVAQGTYTENLTINISVTLEGGYEAISWTRSITQYETIVDGSGSQTVPGDWDDNTLAHPRVISDSGQYRMWYNGQNLTYPNWGWTLGLAESPDGLNWTKHGDNPILEPGDDGEWDSMYRGQAAMMEDGGPYKMWYSGSDGGPWQTGYATSTNGIDWNIYTDNPVLSISSGSWDEQEANGPTVIKDDGLYKMWYHGCDPDYTICSIGYATSTNGLDWSKHAGNPVLTGTEGEWDEGTALWPSVVKDGSTYKMWYYGGGGKIGLATSPDGVNWTKHAGNPVLTEGWDGIGAYAHTVILEGGTYRMWLRSGTDNSLGIGYAESTDGISWTLSISNPVLTPGTPGQWGDPVVRFEAGSDGAVLDGFTITGGDAFAGGGLLIANGGSALVANCHITGNQANAWAGGVWVTDVDATIRDSTISYNNSGGSAGIEVNHDFGLTHLDLVSCKVEHNTGGQIGGLQVWGDQASATVVDVTFFDNEGFADGGGIALNNGSSAVISNTLVYSNTAHNSGAGISVREGSSITIYGTQVYANTAQGGQGGGISGEGGDIRLTSSWVVGNVAENNEGGGIAVGEGGSFYGENCIIAGNHSGTSGGGLWFIQDGPFHLVNCDVVGNDTANEGGALATSYSTQIEITNTLIISNGGNTGIADRDGSGSTITLGYCDTFGNSPDGADGVTITRNNCLGTPPEDGLDSLMSGRALPSGVGPAFATQWMSYDYHLQAASPAIDAGTPVDAPTHDIKGTPRDTAPDMGAYEWTEFRIFLPVTLKSFGP